MGENLDSPTAPSPTKLGGIGAIDTSLINSVASSGGKGAFPAGATQGINAVPSDIGSGAYASSPDYYLTQGKKQLKNQLLDMAMKSTGGGEWRNYGMSPQTTVGEEQPAWQKGFNTLDLYNQKLENSIQQQKNEIVQRYLQGQVI